MAVAVQMPALSPTMTEGKITKWLKKEGDPVSSGQAIAECETDKSNLEIEAYDDGVLLKIVVPEGELAKVGAPIGYIGKRGETVGAAAPASGADSAIALPGAATVPAAAPTKVSNGQVAAKAEPKVVEVAKVREAPEAAGAPTKPGRLRASPLARRIASHGGLDLRVIEGSGPSGRIIRRDVERALAAKGAAAPVLRAPAPAPAPAPGPVAATRKIPLSAMRRVIAQRLTEAKPGVPHFYLNVDVDMGAALRLREEAKALEVRVSVNDIVVKAAAVALRRFPKMNVSFGGDHVVQHAEVDVGVAVAIEEGLITPIIRAADSKSLSEIGAETRDLAERARRKALKPEEYAGGSLTVSNLGMYGIDSFSAIINPPHAGILAVGQVAQRAVVRDGQVQIRDMMTMTLSGDHRAIDGAVGAEYLKELRALLEHPMRLLF